MQNVLQLCKDLCCVAAWPIKIQCTIKLLHGRRGSALKASLQSHLCTASRDHLIHNIKRTWCSTSGKQGYNWGFSCDLLNIRGGGNNQAESSAHLSSHLFICLTNQRPGNCNHRCRQCVCYMSYASVLLSLQTCMHGPWIPVRWCSRVCVQLCKSIC